jgi:hypothetical protein
LFFLASIPVSITTDIELAAVFVFAWPAAVARGFGAASFGATLAGDSFVRIKDTVGFMAATGINTADTCGFKMAFAAFIFGLPAVFAGIGFAGRFGCSGVLATELVAILDATIVVTGIGCAFGAALAADLGCSAAVAGRPA